jgi:glucose-1-phosphate adenylyltransferase
MVLASHCGEPERQRERAPALLAAHFGGKFRAVDFALSNCLNSGIRRVGVVTSYKSHSLARHLERGWASLKRDNDPFVDLLPPPSAKGDGPGSCGTAEQAARHREALAGYCADYVLVIGGDHIHKMNYAVMLADHVAKGLECTVACIEMPPGRAWAGARVTVDERGHISRFANPMDWAAEPHGPKIGKRESESKNKGKSERLCLPIYIFNAKYLDAELTRVRADPGSSHDFASDMLLRAVGLGQAAAHAFARSCVGTAPGALPYWSDISTTDAYWSANIDLTASRPPLDLYDPQWPIRTNHAELAPAKFLHNEPGRCGMALESLVAGGSVISGSVRRSVLFSGVRVHSYAEVKWSVLLPEVEVGRHARLDRVVVERGCSIPEGLVVGEDALVDAERFVRSEQGITLVTAERLARLTK